MMNDPEYPLLNSDLADAIRQTSEGRVKHLLLALCNKDVTARNFAKEWLLVNEHFLPNNGASSSDDLSSEDGASESDPSESDVSEPRGKKRPHPDSDDVQPPSKRLVKRFQKCENCNEEYDVTQNTQEACRYHPGSFKCLQWKQAYTNKSVGTREADMDGDFWADHDENCHGRIEDLEDEFPEGFRWDCCDELGDQEGCEIDWHRPKH
jgi:hypothetical protein